MLTKLSQFLRLDVSTLEDQELIEGARQAEAVIADHVMEAASGRLLAELYRRGHSWPELVRLTGLSQGTIWRRAQPFL